MNMRQNWRADCPKCVGSKFTCDEHNRPEIECRDCDGEGWTMKRNLSLGPGLYEHDCEACKGHGWRSMTDDELDAAAERQAEDAMSEPPVTMQEDYERAQRQRRELRR